MAYKAYSVEYQPSPPPSPPPFPTSRSLHCFHFTSFSKLFALLGMLYLLCLAFKT